MARDILYSVFRHGRIVGSGTCLPPAGVGGSQFTMTLWMGYGELGPPHFPGYTPAWCNPKMKHLYTACRVQEKRSSRYEEAKKTRGLWGLGTRRDPSVIMYVN